MRLIRPRLITFDVTGTLLYTTLVESYENIGLQHGIKIDRSKLAPSFKSNYKQLSKEHPIYGKHTGLGWENWWKIIVHNVYRNQDPAINHQTLDRIATTLIENYGTSKCWYKYPGTHELLEYLTKRNITLGVISNFDERLESILKCISIRPYFSFVITSYSLGVEKPDPLIFDKALKSFKEKTCTDILPSEALHIGNTIELDYIGAKQAGWNALLINHDNEAINNNDVPKDKIVGNLNELRIYLSKILDDE